RCNELQPCVECKVFKSGNYSPVECRDKCTFDYQIDPSLESREGDRRCVYFDREDCAVSFNYEYTDNKLYVRVREERECAAAVNTTIVVGSVAGSIFVIGLILLLIGRLIIWYKDKLEWEKFEAEASNTRNAMAKSDTEMNPLFKPARTNHENPICVAYGRSVPDKYQSGDGEVEFVTGSPGTEGEPGYGGPGYGGPRNVFKDWMKFVQGFFKDGNWENGGPANFGRFIVIIAWIGCVAYGRSVPNNYQSDDGEVEFVTPDSGSPGGRRFPGFGGRGFPGFGGRGGDGPGSGGPRNVFRGWMDFIRDFFKDGNWENGGPGNFAQFIGKSVTKLVEMLTRNRDDD
ncbi:unnamed protein product, partial [Medioppia subpectinata]